MGLILESFGRVSLPRELTLRMSPGGMVLDGLLVMLCLGLGLVSSVLFYFRSWKKDICLYCAKYLSGDSFLEVRELLWYLEMETHLFRCAFAMQSLSVFQMVIHQGLGVCQSGTSASETQAPGAFLSECYCFLLLVFSIC